MASRGSTLLHYIQLLAVASDVRLSSDSESEIVDLIETIENELADLRTEVRDLRSLVTPVTR